jgi:hypothetical protein
MRCLKKGKATEFVKFDHYVSFTIKLFLSELIDK